MYDKICGVCNDRAVGYNFGALTCESCRSFFRRNATRVEEFSCFFGDNCVVNCLTRKFCKKCRIDKCLAIGMKKEALISGEDDKHRRGRRKKLKAEEPVHSTNDGQLIPVDNHNKQYGQSPNIMSQLPDIIRGLIFELNELELSRFKKLFGSMATIKDPTVKVGLEANTYHNVFPILETRNELKIKRIVKMATTMTEFSDLAEDDKIQLLKTTCPEIVTLLTVVNFDWDKEFWTVPIDDITGVTIPLTVLKWGLWDLYGHHRQFMFNLKQEFDTDINIIDLLAIIVLFNPNKPNLIHRDLIKLQQQTYMYLLQRYLEIKHNSKTESEVRFKRLMNCLQELYAVNGIHMSNYLANKDKSPPPLVQEIYSI